ncbi:MAG: glycosyltransferase family 4 protein [Nitrospirota bacterium]
MRLFFIKKRFVVHGGAENYLNLLIESLKTGHDIHLLANEWAPASGIHFHRVASSSLSSFASVLSFNRNACRLLRAMNPDCTISFERTTCQDVYRAGEGCHAEWLRIRKDTESRSKRLSFRLNPLHLSLLKIEKELFCSTRHIIANSMMVRENIIRHYDVPEERISLIYNGVDLKRFRPENRNTWRLDVRKRFSLPDDAILLLFVGSGFKRKGLQTLMKALSILRQGHKEICLVAAGRDNPDYYKKLADSYRISEAVHFADVQPKIEEFYAASDIFVLPTLYDPFSNATLEAMASGLPVITTKNNGASELIRDGQEGYILNELFDAGELAARIEQAIGNIEAMGKTARIKAEGFSIKRAADEFLSVIEKAAVRNTGR